MGPPERESLLGVEGVEIAMRDFVPGLMVDREVEGQCEPVIKQRAPGEETGELERQYRVADPPDTRSVARSNRGGRRGRGMRWPRGDHLAHRRNLTARIGE